MCPFLLHTDLHGMSACVPCRCTGDLRLSWETTPDQYLNEVSWVMVFMDPSNPSGMDVCTTESFGLVDSDQDGLISAGELEAFARDSASDHVEIATLVALFSGADADGDGMVSLDECLMSLTPVPYLSLIHI